MRNPESHTNYAFKVAVLEDAVTELKTEIKKLTGNVKNLQRENEILTQNCADHQSVSYELKEALKLANEQVKRSDLRIVELNRRLQEAHELVAELKKETSKHEETT